jgi:AcrR family transcriptional regulator
MRSSSTASARPSARPSACPSARLSAPAPASDLTAKARIRDAAIAVFGQRGFDIGIRAIAPRAGVSSSLVIHHYGSKARLRQVCDAHIADLVRQIKLGTLQGQRDRAEFQLLSDFTELEQEGPLLGYMIRSLQSGGEAGEAFFDLLLAEGRRYLAYGVEQGTIRPSRDPEARIRWLAQSEAGGMMLWFSTRHHGTGEEIDFAAELRAWERENMLPLLELYTQGLLTDRTMLDAYLAYRDGDRITPPVTSPMRPTPGARRSAS